MSFYFLSVTAVTVTITLDVNSDSIELTGCISKRLLSCIYGSFFQLKGEVSAIRRKLGIEVELVNIEGSN